MVAMPPYAGSHDGMPADQREQLLPLPRFTRRVNVNTEDEATIGQLLHLTFIEARRICMERPFQDAGELLKVRGMSRITMQQWEAGLRSSPFFPFCSLPSLHKLYKACLQRLCFAKIQH